MKKVIIILMGMILTLISLGTLEVNAKTNEEIDRTKLELSIEESVPNEEDLIDVDEEVMNRLSSEEFETEGRTDTKASTNISNSYNNNYKLANADGSNWAYWINSKDSRGLTAYCIQPTVYMNGGTYNTFTPTNLPVATINKIMLIAYYGADNISTSQNYKFATQILIREAITGRDASVFYLGRAVNTSKEESQIMNLVNKHYIKPSFENMNFNAITGESIQVADSKGVLADFDVVASNNYKVSRNGNTLTITPLVAGNINVKLEKRAKFGKTKTMLWWNSPNSQNVLSGSTFDPVALNFTIKAEDPVGSLKLSKTSSETGEVLPGAVFELYKWNEATSEYDAYINQDILQQIEESEDLFVDEETNEIVMINPYTQEETRHEKKQNYFITSQGVLHLTEIPLGDYAVKEIIAPTGYVVNNSYLPFTVASNDEEIVLDAPNEVLTSKINISKTDSRTQKLLGGATMMIEYFDLDLNKWVVYDKYETLDNEVLVIEDVPYGKYRVSEIVAPNGYTLSDLNIEFYVNEHGATIDIEFPNTKALVKTGLVDMSYIFLILGALLVGMKKFKKASIQ